MNHGAVLKGNDFREIRILLERVTIVQDHLIRMENHVTVYP